MACDGCSTLSSQNLSTIHLFVNTEREKRERERAEREREGERAEREREVRWEKKLVPLTSVF